MTYGMGQRTFRSMTDAELHEMIGAVWPPPGFSDWPVERRMNYTDWTGSATTSNARHAREELARRAAPAPQEVKT